LLLSQCDENLEDMLIRPGERCSVGNRIDSCQPPKAMRRGRS
jgi:hypothetical protein